MNRPDVSIRDPKPGDAARIAALLTELGYPATVPEVKARLRALPKPSNRDRVLLATLDETVIGLAALHVIPVLHLDRPIGRVTALVVERAHQGQGVGQLLLREAERFFRQQDCALVELVSAEARTQAHALYRQLGYRERRLRFTKSLLAS